MIKFDIPMQKYLVGRGLNIILQSYHVDPLMDPMQVDMQRSKALNMTGLGRRLQIRITPLYMENEGTQEAKVKFSYFITTLRQLMWNLQVIITCDEGQEGGEIDLHLVEMTGVVEFPITLISR